jgi:hypothetical protein
MAPTSIIQPPVYKIGSSDMKHGVKAPSYLPGSGLKDKEPVCAEEWLKSKYLSNCSWNTFWRDETARQFCRIVDSPDTEEVILDGSIGWGKSHFGRLLVMRRIYELTCMANPGMTLLGNPVASLKIALMSVKGKKSREVLFDKLKAMIDATPYFQREARYNVTEDTARLITVLKFERGITLEPVVSNIGAVISDDLVGFLLDEANFLPKVRGSKRAISDDQEVSPDGIWSAAREFAENADTRMRSRFMKNGKYHGRLWIISSSVDDSDFTEARRLQAEIDGRLDKQVIYISKSLWEGNAPGTYSDETFDLDLGKRGAPPRILPAGEPPIGEVIQVPINFKNIFRDRPIAATREIAGRRSAPRNVWLTDDTVLKRAWDPERRTPCRPVQISGDPIRVDPNGLAFRDVLRGGLWRPRHYPDLPRVAHIDLSITGDGTGISMGCSPGMIEIPIMDHEGGELVVVIPKVHVDFTLRVLPPIGGRIDFIEIERFILMLRTYGFLISLVTFDAYQSERSIQTFEAAGIPSRRLSVDKNPMPYMTLARVLRAVDDEGAPAISVPYSEALEGELTKLIEDARTGIVDHPPNGSKDIADSLAAVSHALVDPNYLPWALSRVGGAANIPSLPL